MSDSTSTPSLTSEFPSDSDDLTADQLTDGLDLGFDGSEDILRSWRKGMRPDPDLTVSEWADEHRWLSSRGAAEPGVADPAFPKGISGGVKRLLQGRCPGLALPHVQQDFHGWGRSFSCDARRVSGLG